MRTAQYDDIVVGSGVGGLTAALLLASRGRRVLVLERAPLPGGALRPFRREGLRCDVGLHFCGGVGPNGTFCEMLSLLGISDSVEVSPFPSSTAFRFLFGEGELDVRMPCGLDALRSELKARFAGDSVGIDQAVDAMARVSASVPRPSDAAGLLGFRRLDEDYHTLRSAMERFRLSSAPRAVLESLCMCLGARPDEVSFADYSRVCHDLWDTPGFVHGGGGALLSGLLARLTELGVEVRCGTRVVGCAGLDGRNAGALVLDTGEEIGTRDALLAVDPSEILNILPSVAVRPAFRNRVASFTPSMGFFTVYGVCRSGEDAVAGAPLSLLLPRSDLCGSLPPGNPASRPLVVVKGIENGSSIVHALEPSDSGELESWVSVSDRGRSDTYVAYKDEATSRIVARVGVLLEQGESFDAVASASMLTYRDWLGSSAGGAYGIRPRVGQYNILGPLPVRNLYAIGQSALLPGVAGTMLTSFAVCSMIDA